MPRDGAGTYTLPAGNPVVAGETIFADWANSTLDDIAIALTESIAYDNLPGELEDIIGGINDLPVLSENNIWLGSNTFNGAVIFQSTADFNGAVTFDSSVTVTGTLTVEGDAIFNNPVTMTAGLDVTGDSTFDDIYCNNLYALTGTGRVKSKENHNAKIILYEDSDTGLVGTPELTVTMAEAAGTHTLTLAAGTVTDGDYMIVTTGTGNVGDWVFDSVGRVKIPASATAIDDARHLASKGYVDTAIGTAAPSPALLTTIAGKVSSAGSILAGAGFSVSKTGTGAYTITLSSSASTADNLIVTCSPLKSAPDRHYTATPYVVSANSIQVKTGQGNSYAAEDNEFTFLVVDAGAT